MDARSGRTSRRSSQEFIVGEFRHRTSDLPRDISSALPSESARAPRTAHSSPPPGSQRALKPTIPYLEDGWLYGCHETRWSPQNTPIGTRSRLTHSTATRGSAEGRTMPQFGGKLTPRAKGPYSLRLVKSFQAMPLDNKPTGLFPLA